MNPGAEQSNSHEYEETLIRAAQQGYMTTNNA